MHRVKCIVSYDGSNFAGFQIQPTERTVHGELEKALKKIHKGLEVPIAASGRTDAGVHAVGQVIHFDTPLSIEAERWPRAFQGILPSDVNVRSAAYVDSDFHARFGTTKKEYRYRVLASKEADVFRRNYTYHFYHPLDIEAMREAASYVIGTHDFTSFSGSKTVVENKVRTIFEFDVLEAGDEIVFRVVGNGFLYNMVRLLVGALLEVGRNKKVPEAMKDILARKQRGAAGKKAPGHGLYLWEVGYE